MKRLCCLMSFTAALGLLPCLASAGNDVGNGGNAVVCRNTNGSIRSAELLDFYEARRMRGILPQLGSADLPVEVKLSIALSSFEKKSPFLAAYLNERASAFSNEALFLDGAALEPIPDSHHLAHPVGCDVEQLAIQRVPTFPEDKRYTVNNDIWMSLDNDSKAGLILHEVLYGMVLSLPNSTGIRYVNSLLTSLRLENMTSRQLIETFGTSGLNWIDVQGVPVDPGQSPLNRTFYNDGSIRFAVTTPWFNDHLFSVKVSKQIIPGSVQHVTFYPNGSVRSLGFYVDSAGRAFDTVALRVGVQQTTFDDTCVVWTDEWANGRRADLFFHDNGSVHMGCQNGKGLYFNPDGSAEN